MLFLIWQNEHTCSRQQNWKRTEVNHSVANRTKPAVNMRINRSRLLYCKSTEAIYNIENRPKSTTILQINRSRLADKPSLTYYMV